MINVNQFLFFLVGEKHGKWMRFCNNFPFISKVSFPFEHVLFVVILNERGWQNGKKISITWAAKNTTYGSKLDTNCRRICQSSEMQHFHTAAEITFRLKKSWIYVDHVCRHWAMCEEFITFMEVTYLHIFFTILGWRFFIPAHVSGTAWIQ